MAQLESGINKERRRPASSTAKLAGLVLPAEEFWDSRPELRTESLRELDERFQQYLDDLYDAANLCVDRYEALSRSNTRWRFSIIVGTGVVAIVNSLAANRRIADATINVVPITAAIFAVVLTVVANLESFYGFSGKAQGFRESREIFLDAAREYELFWDVYVRPFGDAPEAWLNATELNKRIVSTDKEIRIKFKELTKSGKKPTSK